MSDGFEVTLRGHLGAAPQRRTTEDGRDRVEFDLAVNGIKQRTAAGGWTRKGEHRAVWCQCVYFPRTRNDDSPDPVLEALLLKLGKSDAVEVGGEVTEVSTREATAGPEVRLGVTVRRVVIPITSRALPDRD